MTITTGRLNNKRVGVRWGNGEMGKLVEKVIEVLGILYFGNFRPEKRVFGQRRGYCESNGYYFLLGLYNYVTLPSVTLPRSHFPRKTK